MKSLIAAIETATRWVGCIGAWIIVPLAGSMLWEVCSRHVFSRPTIWAYEAAYMQLGALFVLTLGYVAQVDGHVRVDLLYDRFPPRGRAMINLLGMLLVAPLVLWLCVGLWEYLLQAWRSGERSGESIWNPLVWPARATFFVGFLFWALQILAGLLKSLHVLVSGIEFGKEA